MTPLEAALDAIAKGFCLTPLVKKIPVNKGWQKAPRPTELQVRDWIQMGYDLGVRTGPPSGVVVLDLDPGSPWTPDMFPDAPCAKSPRGHHLYFASSDPPPKNSASKLAPGVDVRGAGGQVAMPGTAERPWLRQGAFPPWPFPVEQPKPRAQPRPSQAGSNAWANKALNVECEQLAAAQEGTRHDRLNIAAFNLGQIVAGGALDHATVADTLTSIGLQIGLDEKDVTRTVADGLEAGAKTPRTPPVRPPPVHVEIEDEPHASDPVIEPVHTTKRQLVKVDAPGEHWEGGAARSVSNARFAYQVLKAFEPGDLYRRMGVVGFVRGASFEPADVHSIRLLMDNRVIIFEHPMMTTRQLKEVQYVTSSVDHANVVLAAAKTHKNVRDLEILSPHPIATPDFKLLLDGWHPEHNALVVFPYDLSQYEPLPFWDAIQDFPMSEESKAGALSALLCPIFRPLLDGNVPMHLVTAPLERSGKTMFVGDVLGPILGVEIEMTTWAEDEDEMRKQIVATLLEGTSIMCIDNVPAVLDSHNIASLITTRTVGGRVLGQSKAVHAPNRLCLIATGNNTEASGEMAKRCNLIRIEPPDAAPEKRTGFRYPNLLAAVRELRPRYWRWIADLIEKGPRGVCPAMGGFQPYTVTVGALVVGQGLPLLSDGHKATIRETEDLAGLFAVWKERVGDAWMTTTDLIPIAESIEWGGVALDPAKSTRTRSVWLGKRLSGAVGRFAAGARLERRTTRGRTEYRLA